MNFLIGALLLISSSAFASDLTATDALLSLIPANEYQGKTLTGNTCEVSVTELSDKVIVVASSGATVKRTEVLLSAHYRWNPGNRSFLSSVITRNSRSSHESLIRTIAVQNHTQYVVVADIHSSSDRNNHETKVECIINL